MIIKLMPPPTAKSSTGPPKVSQTGDASEDSGSKADASTSDDAASAIGLLLDGAPQS